MKRYKVNFIIAWTILFLFEFKIILAQDLTPIEIFNKTDSSLVMIVVKFIATDTVSQGSGIIADERGIIITNYHLIDKKNDINFIKVIHKTDTLTNIRIIGSNAENDLLILKAMDFTLKPITWTENQNHQVGETIYTISSPRGLENTLSTGIISGLNRTIGINTNLIQFTADVQPGSSGGALLNSRGELIGIIVSKFLNSNLNFAIPISIAWNTYTRASTFIVQQKLDVLSEDYKNRLNIYVEDLVDTLDLYKMGEASFKKGDFADAIFYYTLYLEQETGDENVYYQRGRSLFAFKYDSLAIQDYNKSFEINRNRVDLLFDIGWYYYTYFQNYTSFPSEPYYSFVDSSFLQKAIYYFKKSIDFNPNYIASYIELASLYNWNFKNVDSSIIFLNNAIERNKVGFLYYRKSMYNQLLGKDDEKYNDLSNAIKYRFNDSLITNCPIYWWPFHKNMYWGWYFISRGKIDFSLKRYRKAIKDFSSCIGLKIDTENDLMEDSNTNEALSLRSECYYELEEYENALEDIESLIKKSGESDKLLKRYKQIKRKINGE